MPKGYSDWNQRAGSTPAERIAYYSVTQPSGCVLWSGGFTRGGYPSISIDGKHHRVSRVVLAMKLGRPLRAQALHKCDNPGCIAEDHLEEGTQKKNLQDCVARGRHNPVYGTRNWQAKLTPNQVRQIRRSNLSERKLGAKFGISGAVAGNIRRNKAWKHIT